MRVFIKTARAQSSIGQLSIKDKIRRLKSIDMNKELNVGNQVSAPSEEDLTQLVSCYENKQYAQTSDLAEEIIERYPQHQFTWKILGSALTQEGRVDEALEATKNAVQLAPGDADSHFNLGNLFFKLSQFNEAADSQLRAIELNQDDLQAYSALAKTLVKLEKLEEAEKYLRLALQKDPNSVVNHFTLSEVLRKRGEFAKAEGILNELLIMKPTLAEGHYNLGVIQRDLEDYDRAAVSYERAIALKSHFIDAYKNLGLIEIIRGNLDKALLCFTNSATLLRGQQQKNPNPSHAFGHISQAKITHDIEQFEYLKSKDVNPSLFDDLASLYKKLAREIPWPSSTEVISIKKHYQDAFQGTYNRILHQPDSKGLNYAVLNEELDTKKITQDYYSHSSGLTFFDNFLCTPALESLREHLLESTIWFNVKQGGYLGAYLAEGLACPVILQIAKELPEKFPEIFRSHALKQVWAYKYENQSRSTDAAATGIKVHADFAAVNVNFWITPSESNLKRESGGLKVHDIEAPPSWDFESYNSDEELIRKEIEIRRHETSVIPYRANRIVIFNSNLFHETDEYEFKEGYENRRVNVTMLFGERTSV